MSGTQTTPAQSFSKAALTGASEVLFPDQPAGSFNERVVANPNAANPIWLNLMGGAAVANGADCIQVAALQSIRLYNSNQINVIGTAADKVTAIQR